MLKIVNSEIEIIFSPLEKKINTPEHGYYSQWLECYIEFKSKGISLAGEWGCFVGDLDEFKSKLLDLKNDKLDSEVIFSPQEGMVALSIAKSEERNVYPLHFRIFAEIRSDIFVQGETSLGHLNIDELLSGLNSLINF
jgi:hypothetical protein